jgi:hypothetical protein
MWIARGFQWTATGVTVTKQIFPLPAFERASLQAQLPAIDAIVVYLVRVHARVRTPSPMTAQVRPLLVHRVSASSSNAPQAMLALIAEVCASADRRLAGPSPPAAQTQPAPMHARTPTVRLVRESPANADDVGQYND